MKQLRFCSHQVTRLSTFNFVPVLFLVIISFHQECFASMPKKPTNARQEQPTKTEAAYHIASLAPNLHTYQITITLQNSKKQDEIDFILPAWRPGRYQIQNYAANVQEFLATSAGKSLEFKKIDKQTWRVNANGAKEIVVRYKYFAGAAIDAGNSYVGREEMYFNGSNLFMFTKESRFKPVSLFVDYPNGWKIATQLTKTSDPRLFTAETYDDLIDSPTLASPTMVEFQATVKGALIRMCFQNAEGIGLGRFNEKNIVRDVSKFVEEQFTLMNDVPFKEYIFIYHVLPIRYSHGVEHKNSTSIVVGASYEMDSRYSSFLSVSSHEFFHVWNIKRIIPKEYFPYDYTTEGYTPMLYVSEGFTSYYGDLTLVRSGVWTARDYIRNLGNDITAMQNTYGRKVQSVALASFDAWLSGYGAGRANSTVNFYSKGELIGLILDLEIRNKTKNKKSLDDVMREMNSRFGKAAKGFSAKDFETTCERVAGSKLSEFFEKYVYGTEELPFKESLSFAGLDLLEDDSNSPYIGVSVVASSDFQLITSIIPESPAFKAGLDQNDLIIAVGNESLLKESLTMALERFSFSAKDTTINFSVIRNKKLLQIPVTLSASKRYLVQKNEDATAEQKDIFESWMKTKWNDLF
ncbi:MAG: PDZ domain-containing protein [Chloroherpetonaceae bacterium]|nr:PDZ domain-containing protein [Chloroherpetonaceae bacterium]